MYFYSRRELVLSERWTTGVYTIFNVDDNNRLYIGSAAKSVGRRWGNHLSLLRRGIHPNIYLQRAWKKYGEAAFVFMMIEQCEPSECIPREQYWIDTLHAFGEGYNMLRRAGSRYGAKLSKESKEKIAAAHRGRKASAETRRKMSEARKGVPRSLSHQMNLAENHWTKGEKAKETAAKIARGNSGKTFSEERRENISRSKLEKDIPDQEVVERYLLGESVNALGTAFDVDNCVIKRKLLKNGVPLRGRSAAARIRPRR